MKGGTVRETSLIGKRAKSQKIGVASNSGNGFISGCFFCCKLKVGSSLLLDIQIFFDS